MKRRELEVALRAASRVARDLEFVLIGSQAVHAHSRRPLAEVLLSQECDLDLYPRTHPIAAGRLKDLELAGALLKLRLAAVSTVRRRIRHLPELRDRHKAESLLKIVLEDST
jgi:hypothetical protein